MSTINRSHNQAVTRHQDLSTAVIGDWLRYLMQAFTREELGTDVRPHYQHDDEGQTTAEKDAQRAAQQRYCELLLALDITTAPLVLAGRRAARLRYIHTLRSLILRARRTTAYQ